MSHDSEGHCHCVKNHNPEPLELAHHHVWPLGMGGPNIPENMVWLCPTAHANVHELLRLFLALKGGFTFQDATELYEQPVNRYAFSVARLGWLRFNRGGLLIGQDIAEAEIEVLKSEVRRLRAKLAVADIVISGVDLKFLDDGTHDV